MGPEHGIIILIGAFFQEEKGTKIPEYMMKFSARKHTNIAIFRNRGELLEVISAITYALLRRLS